MIDHLHGRARAVAALVLASVIAQGAAAAERVRPGAGADRNTARLLKEGPPADEDSTSKFPWTVRAGAFHDRASDGERVLSLPFLFSYAPNRWYVEVSGDGYQQVKAGADRSRGLADVALIVNYTKTFGPDGQHGLVPELELDLPTHGEVGSSRISRALRLTLSGAFGPWGVDLSGAASRDGDTPEASVSRYGRSIDAAVRYEWQPNLLVSLGVERATQRGAPATTSWRGEFDFPILQNLTAIVSAVISRADTRTRSFGFELAFAF